MNMTNAEIAHGYQVRTKSSESTIKAQAAMNGCTEDEIRDILDDEGVDLSPRPKKRWGTVTPEVLARLRELYDQGLNDSEIAQKLEFSRGYVAELRRRQGLPALHGSRGRRIRLETGAPPAEPSGPPSPPAEPEPAAPAGPEASGPPGCPYTVIERIFSVIPKDAGEPVRIAAAALAARIIEEYAGRRLGGEAG